MSINGDLRYKKPSEEIIRDLIWFSNGFKIPSGVVTFGSPRAFAVSPYDSIGRDTRVDLHGKLAASKLFQGTTTVFYRRLTFQELTPLNDNKITVNKFPFSTFDVVEQINAKYGILLTSEDVHDIHYESMEGPYTLRAKADSLVWKGEMDIEVEFYDLDLIKLTDLSGFKKVDDTLPWAIYQTVLGGLVWRPSDQSGAMKVNLSDSNELYQQLVRIEDLSKV